MPRKHGHEERSPHAEGCRGTCYERGDPIGLTRTHKIESHQTTSKITAAKHLQQRWARQTHLLVQHMSVALVFRTHSSTVVVVVVVVVVAVWLMVVVMLLL